MRILLISHSSKLYGSERSLLALAEDLKRSKHFFSVLCPSPGSLSKELQKLEIPVFYMHFPGLGTRSIKEILIFTFLFIPTVIRLTSWIRKNKIQIVYNNTINALYGPFAAKLQGIQSIWHIREVKPKNTLLTRIAGIIINRMSSKVIFNSYATMKAFKNRPHSSWRVIYNGIEVKHPYNNKNLNSHFVMGFAGQMAEHKRPERFLYIFSQVRKQMTHVKGIMAGDGPLLPKLRSIAEKLDIANDITFTGFLPDIGYFYSNIDVLILTSDHEPFGRVIIEAMSYGRTVVAAAVDGVLEVVEDGSTGYLVHAEDITAYTRKILFLFKNREYCRQMGEAARRRVLERFGKSRNQQELIRLLVNQTA